MVVKSAFMLFARVLAHAQIATPKMKNVATATYVMIQGCACNVIRTDQALKRLALAMSDLHTARLLLCLQNTPYMRTCQETGGH